MYNFKKRLVSITSAVAIVMTGANVPEMTFTSYAEEAQKPIVSQKVPGWTFGIYLCGQDLESERQNSTNDLIEILKAEVPEGFSKDNNIIVETGGCRAWHFKEVYSEYLMNEKGLSEKEVEQIIPNEIDSAKLSQYKVNFEHKYTADDGKVKTIPTLEFIKDVADYDVSAYVEEDEETEDKRDEETKEKEIIYANMGDEYYLNAFMEDLDNEFPAEHMALDLWNHGGGIVDGVCFDAYTNDGISLMELKSVLKNRVDEGKDKLDLIGYDACIMSNYETWVNLSAYAKVGVGSLTDEPGDGWNYTPFMEKLGKNYNNDSYTAVSLASDIVDAYKDYYTKDSEGYNHILANQIEIAGAETEEDIENIKYDLDSDLSYAMLCAVDLDKIAKTSDDFKKMGDNLFRAYVDEEGVNNIFKMASDIGDISQNADIVDLSKLIESIYTVASDRLVDINSYDGSYYMIAKTAYSNILESAKNIEEGIKDSLINAYNGWEDCNYYDSLGMSVYIPSYYSPSANGSYGIDEYPGYAISDGYAKLLYLYAGKLGIEEYMKDIYDASIECHPHYEYDSEIDMFSAYVDFDEIRGMESLEGDTFVKVGGKYYLVDTEYGENGWLNIFPIKNYYSLSGDTPVDAFDWDGNAILCTGTLNGELGQFIFSYSTDGRYIFDRFNYDNSEDGLSVTELKVGDKIALNSKEAKEPKFSVNYTKEDKNTNEVLIKEYVVSDADFSEGEMLAYDGAGGFDETSYKGYRPALVNNEISDDQITIALTCIKHTEFDEDYNIAGCDYETKVFDYGKIKLFNTANITVEKEEFELTGEAITPKVIFEGADFVEGKDYEVTYENNIGIGEATAIIVPIGDIEVAGTRVVNFKIVKSKDADGKVVYKTVVVKTPKQAKIKYVKNNKKKALTVKWKKVKGASGYVVRIARNKKFTKGKKVKTIKSVKKTAFTFKKLKKNKTYFVKVRAYKLDPNGKKVYGDWSKIKKIKITK